MKYIMLVTSSLIISHHNLHSMAYVLAPFKSTYTFGRYIVGNKTYLEIEIDSFLKTTPIPWNELTTHEKLESFIQTKIEEHINNKAKTSPLFLAYLGTLAIKNQDALIQKIENNVNAFVSKELQKRVPLSEGFVLVDENGK